MIVPFIIGVVLVWKGRGTSTVHIRLAALAVIVVCELLALVFAPESFINPFHPQAPHYDSPVKPYHAPKDWQP